jgi:hypothetical protein
MAGAISASFGSDLRWRDRRCERAGAHRAGSGRAGWPPSSAWAFLIVLVGKIPILGKLPGDVVIRRGDFTCFFPLMTSIILSVILSLVLWLISRFLGRWIEVLTCV